MATAATKPIPAPPKQKRTRSRRLKLWIALFLMLGVLSIDLYVRSSAFQERVRRKIVTELEKVTGGKVVLGAFHWNLYRMEFEAFELTIQGTESAAELPY